MKSRLPGRFFEGFGDAGRVVGRGSRRPVGRLSPDTLFGEGRRARILTMIMVYRSPDRMWSASAWRMWATKARSFGSACERLG